jgi:hypothetical protein
MVRVGESKKLKGINVDFVLIKNEYLIPADKDLSASATQIFTQHRKRLPQTIARLFFAVAPPQKPRNAVARHGEARTQRQYRQQKPVFPARNFDYISGGCCQAKSAKQLKPQSKHATHIECPIEIRTSSRNSLSRKFASFLRQNNAGFLQVA